MQKTVIFFGGVLIGATAVLTLSSYWQAPPAMPVPAIQPAPPVPPAPALPPTALPASEVATSTATTMQSSSRQPTQPDQIEYTPAQLDELAEQRRERQYREDVQNMHLRYPAAYAGKLAAFKGDDLYASNVQEFAEAEAGGEWAEKAQQALQQYFDSNTAEFSDIQLECRASICQITGRVSSATVFSHYFSSPQHSFFPQLGLSPWGVYTKEIPNDDALGFVLFKLKNPDDFKGK